MLLVLDTLGERYGYLPSEILARGSTLDIYVMDAALTYHDLQHKKSEKSITVDNYNIDELQAMVARSRKS